MPDDDTDFSLGDIIPGNLRLTEVIGEGATGTVFLAEGVDRIFEKYAVKRLDKEHMEQIDYDDYKREILFMKKLSGHSNIVQYINDFETSNHLYLVLEYCETDLFDAIFLRSGFPPALVTRFFCDVANGVIHAHKNGIYHRDIKVFAYFLTFQPENVLIKTTGGEAKLADFGLATTDKYSQEFGVGSIRYLAPECFGPVSNDVADVIDCYFTPAADVWALGVLLLNMIFGRNPWHEASFLDPVFNSYINFDPLILRKNLKITSELDIFLRQKVFNMDPDKRCNVSDFHDFVSSQKEFIEDDNCDPLQIEFINDGEKVNIIQKYLREPEPNCSEGPFSIPNINISTSNESSLSASIAAHIGSMDGFGKLTMSTTDIASPYMESRESRIQLAKKMGVSSITSMDRISSKMSKSRPVRSNGRPLP